MNTVQRDAAIQIRRLTVCPRQTPAKTPPNAVRHIDMYKLMRAFCEAGYSNTMTLDHTPRFVEGYEAAGTGYAIGYMLVLPQHARVASTRVVRAKAELSADGL